MAEPVDQGQSNFDDHLIKELNVVDEDEIQEKVVEPIFRNKKRFRKEFSSVEKRGVCYLSRVPPHMDPSNLRHILSKYGDILRIYLTPEDLTAQAQRKKTGRGRFRGKGFSEGWVEFSKRSVAKRVANLLNGEQIGGKRRSSFYYDIWNVKYLSKFKWDDLTSEIADKNHIREQKLTMEISAAKRERDFYLTKVDQSRALHSMRERAKKKQKTLGSEAEGGIAANLKEPKIIRRHPQNKPVSDKSLQSKPGLSRDILEGVFAAGSS